MVRHRHNGTGSKAQAGATAIEFAFVFPVLFLLFYGILTYGVVFLMRLGLQHSAEEGARAALHHPLGTCAASLGHPCDADEQAQFQLSSRLGAGYAVSAQRAQWMDYRAAPTIVLRVCPVGQDCAVSSSVVSCGSADCVIGAGAAPVCGSDFATSCQVVVTVTYDYENAPFLPTVPGLGLLTPKALMGQARLLLDGRALRS
ncbi:TadE/TadG family type IV pilus assembly protein [Sinimarinibacterium sp. CAU 1509]|uniref:TadE/TadG family type IV pilus assembly protein n=1 Tax=Sinimarinibacterium sp. CAU 1509 TaxID=2562283 RepID=UPI00146D1AC9|nr:TadE family protein [Sinimarinibacterium sp. CAU 1509]